MTPSTLDSPLPRSARSGRLVALGLMLGLLPGSGFAQTATPAQPAAQPNPPAKAAPASTPAAAPAPNAAKAKEQPVKVDPAPTELRPAEPERYPTVEEALKEIDQALVAYRRAIEQEKAGEDRNAMRTKLLILEQQRVDLAKDFTLARYLALKTYLRQPNRATEDALAAGRALSLNAAVNAAVDAQRADTLAALQRDEEYRAARAAEEASRRRMEIARINSDLSRLSAQIDAQTVGDPNRRAELNMRLRDLEQERTRLELSAQPTGFEELRSRIQRESDWATRP